MKLFFLIFNVCFSVLFLLISVTKANAYDRVALVIGNSKYEKSPLKNPVNDARSIQTVFETLNFKVFYYTDLTSAQMKLAQSDFIDMLARETPSIAVFYFAGHGIQFDNNNWMLPVDIDFSKPLDIAQSSLSVVGLMRFIDNYSTYGIVFLDACRNNPYLDEAALSIKKGVLTRSITTLTKTNKIKNTANIFKIKRVEKGLASLEVGKDMLVSFAARPGKLAADSDRIQSNHSPYTQALIKYLLYPGLEIRQILSRVTEYVSKSTRDSQIPWDNSSLTSQVYLKKRTLIMP